MAPGRSATSRRIPPSPALLSWLASLSVSTPAPVAARPLEFLCPWFISCNDGESNSGDTVSRSRSRSSRHGSDIAVHVASTTVAKAKIKTRAAASSAPTPAASSLPNRSRGGLRTLTRRSPTPSRTLPFEYVQGPDGLWHRVDCYLYGTSSCTTPEATASSGSVDDASELPAASSSSPAAPSASENSMDDIDIISTLPVGWQPTSNSTAKRTAWIVALSLGLAMVIFCLMLGVSWWRKRKRKRRDLERRPRRRLPFTPEDEIMQDAHILMVANERAEQHKKRVWARAASRWKAHARYAVRKRGGVNRSSRNVAPLPSAVSSSVQVTGLISCSSRPPSPASDDHGADDSLTNEPEDVVPSITVVPAASASDDIESHSRRGSDGSLNSSHTSNCINVRSSLPPAYQSADVTVSRSVPHGLSRSTSPLLSPSFADLSRMNSRTPLMTDTLPHSCAISSSSHSRSASRTPIPDGVANSKDVPEVHAAHVATDDKALLAQLAALSSAPPAANVDTNGAGAPAWCDEESLPPEHDSSGSSSTSAWTSADLKLPLPEADDTDADRGPAFPPLPSVVNKGKMAEADFVAAEAYEGVNPFNGTDDASYDTDGDAFYTFRLGLQHEGYPMGFGDDFQGDCRLASVGPSAPPFEDVGPCAPPFEDAAASAPPLASAPSMVLDDSTIRDAGVSDHVVEDQLEEVARIDEHDLSRKCSSDVGLSPTQDFQEPSVATTVSGGVSLSPKDVRN